MTQKVEVDSIPAELKTIPRWVGWLWERRNQGKEWTKVPVKPDGSQRASATDQNTWSRWDDVYHWYKVGSIDGVGIVLSESDNLCGVDLDHVRDEASGEIEQWALDIVNMVNSYAEVSPSGTGLRVFVKGALPSGRRRRGNIEAYETARFLTVTGQHLPSTPQDVEYRQVELAQFHVQYLEDEEDETRAAPIEVTGEPPPVSDYAILKRVFDSEGGQAARQLYEGNFQGYASHSEADMALCAKLSFWTQNYAQIDRLFRGSLLYREKWDEFRGADTYGQLTIKQAVNNVQTVYIWDAYTTDESLNEKLQRFLKFGSPKAGRKKNASV